MIDIESTVFSRIKNKYPSELRTKYPDTFFTTSDRTPKDPKFPSIYVHDEGGIERGATLDGENINAVLSTIRIEVYDNVKQGNVTEVMDYVVGVMKTLRYEVIAMPNFQNQADIYRKVARFRRVIGDGETL